VAKKIIVLLFSLIVAQGVFATAQAPDYLEYKGKTYSLNSNPLEPLFKKNPELKTKLSDQNERVVISSGNWRGYVATFKIKNKRLLVKDITIEDHNDSFDEYKEISVINKVLPNKNQRNASWFTGNLIIPIGKQTEYVHLSYASKYESYLMLQVKDGVLIDKAEFNSQEFQDYKKRQFEAYQETQKYKDDFDSLNKDDTEPNWTINFIYSYGEFMQEMMLPFESPLPKKQEKMQHRN